MKYSQTEGPPGRVSTEVAHRGAQRAEAERDNKSHYSCHENRALSGVELTNSWIASRLQLDYISSHASQHPEKAGGPVIVMSYMQSLVSRVHAFGLAPKRNWFR